MFANWKGRPRIPDLGQIIVSFQTLYLKAIVLNSFMANFKGGPQILDLERVIVSC